MSICTQSGCAGVIAADGYCNTCGTPAPTAEDLSVAAALTVEAAPAGSLPPAGWSGAQRCRQVGCPGAVAADGYCNTCGVAGAAPSVPAAVALAAGTGTAVPVAAPPMGGLTGHSCRQSGCAGTIAADGYCDTCGTSAITPSPPAVSHGAASRGETSTHSIAAPAVPGTSRRVTGGGTQGQSRRTSASRRTGSVKPGLGAGLVQIAPTLAGDPSSAVMSPEKIARVLGAVPEEERNCAACGKAVGRAAENGPGRITGFCGNCRTPFDFQTNAPTLGAGDLVGGQYEIVGVLAHGGMGWIYLGRDKAVSDRWVVLKGLLNEDDPDAVAAAVAERQFLAQIEHGNIVNIYNFVTSGGLGYIVMEYVGGDSLNDKLKTRRAANEGRPDPLAPAEAVAYILGILPALGYLNTLGLVYNDLKPANVMAIADDVKLIDVGAVMRWDDPDAMIFGTQGFQAPEMETMGPSIASDLYTVGRTLAVLMLEFVFHTGPYEHALPGTADEPLFARWEALHRFLLKSTAPHPDDRFQSAEEMGAQLLGILRELVALTEGTPRPATSNLFEGDRLSGLLVDSDYQLAVTAADWRALPVPKIDPDDPAAKFLDHLGAIPPAQALEQIDAGVRAGQVPQTLELALRRARAMVECGQNPTNVLDQIEVIDPWEWRVEWYRALWDVQSDMDKSAAERFSRVWTEVPGELAPRLAVAFAAEQAGEHERAAELYSTVVAVDPTYVSAAFGLARCRAAAGDQDGMVNAYAQVPVSSSTYHDAQLATARSLLRGEAGTDPGPLELQQAATTVERLQLDAAERQSLAAEILERALAGVSGGNLTGANGVKLFGHPLEAESLRTALESTYRELARLAPSDAERYELVDRANQIRPKSLV